MPRDYNRGEMEVQAAISTIEVLKAGWPILAGFVGLVAWLTGIAIMAKQTKEDLVDFKNREYSEDKNVLRVVITELKADQEKFEEKLESKLDKMAEKSNAQLEKVYMEINKVSTFLAELKGRLDSRHLPEECD